MDRVEPREERRIGPERRRIVIREDVDPVDPIHPVVLRPGPSAVVVSRQILPHDHPQLHAVVARQRIGAEEDVTDRKVVVPLLAQTGRDAFAFGVEHRNVEHVARMQQRPGRVGQDERREGTVLELVRDRVYAVGRP